MTLGIEFACSAGDLGSILGSGRSPGEGNGNPLVFLPRESHGQRNLVAQLVKNSRVDLASIPGLERVKPGEGKGYSLQYSGLENSMDCIIHGVAESDTIERLSQSVGVRVGHDLVTNTTIEHSFKPGKDCPRLGVQKIIGCILPFKFKIKVCVVGGKGICAVLF